MLSAQIQIDIYDIIPNELYIDCKLQEDLPDEEEEICKIVSTNNSENFEDVSID